MNYESHQIDAIVREVVRRLRAISEDSTASSSTAFSDTVPSDDPACETPTLRWNDPIVTWARLAPEVKGVRRVSFRPRAVVTPLVKDELKQLGIGWTFRKESDAECEARSSSRTLFVWGRDESPEQERAQILASQFSGEQFRIVTALSGEPERGGDEEVLERLASPLKVESRAIMLARHPHRCACLLNRHANICATVARNASQLGQVLEDWQPNVLVFDIERQPLAEVLHAVRTYVRHWQAETMNPPAGKTSH